jgi:UDP:flavonoid glycosyltransferase YjiC (YdhE family)
VSRRATVRPPAWLLPPSTDREETGSVRVAVITGPDPGHAFPAMAIASALRDRGHDVTVSTGLGWRDEVERAGMRFVRLPRLESAPEDTDFGWRMWGRAAVMAPDLVAALDVSPPELVICDALTAAGGFAAELRGVRWAELVTHWLWAPSVALPPVGLGQRPARTPVGRVLERYQRRQQARSIAEGQTHRERARAEVGLPPRGGPDLALVGTLPGLEPPRPDWPERTHLVGLLEWEPPSWPVLDPPPGQEPLVLITDSTASNVDDRVSTSVVDALREGQYRLAVTTDEPVAARPGMVAGRGRHSHLLDHADCAVGYAGHGLVSKALGRGVPMVLVPLQGDQRETAARVTRAGAAITIEPDEVSPERLRDAVRQVLTEPSFAGAARRLARTASGLGPERAYWLVEHRLAGRPR